MFELSALTDLPTILLASWIALPFNCLLVKKTEELSLWLILLVQLLLTPMFTLGYLTHGNMWISAGIPAGIFLSWLVYQCRKDLKRINQEE